METSNYLAPNYNDGRFFISPILGCAGACDYCYLEMYHFCMPQKNTISTKELFKIAEDCEDFAFGENGTIISVGAWGDIFPLRQSELIEHSVAIVEYLLSWGNPVQIMSKNVLDVKSIERICEAVLFDGQLLYSTTITTLEKWKNIEPNTSCPDKRLWTCFEFHKRGIPTNVMLKPFVASVTGIEIDEIACRLLKYQIDFCTVGIMYWNDNIIKRVMRNSFLCDIIKNNNDNSLNHLDCNGNIALNSTDILSIIPFVNYLRGCGINTFLKSSCINSNIIHKTNPSGYYLRNSNYCIQCGNCQN